MGALAPVVASAADAAAPVPNKGDTAWVLVSTVLVIMMTIPGLALFYGGLVRTKNMLSVLTQVMAIVALVGVVWVVYGYSLAFTGSGSLKHDDFVDSTTQALRLMMDKNMLTAVKVQPAIREPTPPRTVVNPYAA